MISEKKLLNAYLALQAVLIWARKRAGDGAHEEVFEILDDAEHLVWLIANGTDETQNFRNLIASISKQFKCEFILDKFDSPAPRDLLRD